MNDNDERIRELLLENRDAENHLQALRAKLARLLRNEAEAVSRPPVI